MMFNNFLSNKIYGKYFVINLGGPIKYFIAKFLIFLKIGKAISCDGNPLIKNISKGINFWSRTTLYIPRDQKDLNNNFVAIKNNHLQKNDHFQIYPININSAQIKNSLKIIFISRINIDVTVEEKNIWEQNKNQFTEEFSLIDDIIQETMLRVRQRAEQYNPKKGQVSTWIFTIARNGRINQFRKHRRQGISTADTFQLVETQTSADTRTEILQTNSTLYQALRSLPLAQAEVIRLSFLEGLTHPQIAGRLRLPLAAVKSRIRLGLARIRFAIGIRT